MVVTQHCSLYLQEHDKRCWCVDFNKMNPHLLASGSDDSKVKIWSSRSSRSVLNIEAVVSSRLLLLIHCLYMQWQFILSSSLRLMSAVSSSTHLPVITWRLEQLITVSIIMIWGRLPNLYLCSKVGSRPSSPSLLLVPPPSSSSLLVPPRPSSSLLFSLTVRLLDYQLGAAVTKTPKFFINCFSHPLPLTYSDTRYISTLSRSSQGCILRQVPEWRGNCFSFNRQPTQALERKQRYPSLIASLSHYTSTWQQLSTPVHRYKCCANFPRTHKWEELCWPRIWCRFYSMW